MKYDGNLKGNATDGLAGADQKCADRAAAASLGGTWVAWLSDSTHNAIDRINDVGPWYTTRGDNLVFSNKAAIPSGVVAPIDEDEHGNTVTDHPWTGTKADGTKAATNCSDWTKNSGAPVPSGECGETASQTASSWTELTPLPCSIPYGLYCFEQ